MNILILVDFVLKYVGIYDVMCGDLGGKLVIWWVVGGGRCIYGWYDGVGYYDVLLRGKMWG